MPSNFVRSICVVIACVMCWTSPLAAQQGPSWPQFLGPQRTGISTEKGLVDAWPQGGIPEVWRVSGGVGMSGCAIAEGTLCTLVQREQQQFCVALDAQTGRQRWLTPLAPAYENSMGHGPRATPTIDKSVVYVFTGEGILAALQFADGKPLWSVDTVQDLGGPVADYGMSCSPLVVGDLVIVTVGGARGTIAAFDKKTGKLAWTVGTDEPAGYSSPALLTLAGRPQVVAFAGASAKGLDPTGRLLWDYPYETDYNCNIATPLAIQGNVLLSAGENHGSVMLAVKQAGDACEVSEVWTSLGTASTLRNEWQTSIHVDGYLYGLDNVGSAGPVTHLTCVEAATGKRMWQQPRFGKSNLIYADGKLIFSTMNGELVLVRAKSAAFEELGRQEVVGKTRQAPALAGGLVYLRDDRDIVCLDLRAK